MKQASRLKEFEGRKLRNRLPSTDTKIQTRVERRKGVRLSEGGRSGDGVRQRKKKRVARVACSLVGALQNRCG
jgi:hypothetical protein